MDFEEVVWRIASNYIHIGSSMNHTITIPSASIPYKIGSERMEQMLVKW